MRLCGICRTRKPFQGTTAWCRKAKVLCRIGAVQEQCVEVALTLPVVNATAFRYEQCLDSRPWMNGKPDDDGVWEQ